MDSLELTFIGTGNAFAPRGLCWNGFLVNGRHLFEAPPQALQALNKLRVDPNEIETVVLSHQHGDHFVGLPFLLLHWEWMNRSKPIRIVAPEGTQAAMMQLCDIAYPDASHASYGIDWIEAVAGAPVQLPGLELEAVEVKHDPKLEHCLGFHVRVSGQALGYTGDSAMCDGVLDLARQSDVLVSECASRAEQLPVHMNLVDDIPRVRSSMASGSELVLSHLGPGIEPGNLPRTRVAADFDTYRFEPR